MPAGETARTGSKARAAPRRATPAASKSAAARDKGLAAAMPRADVTQIGGPLLRADYIATAVFGGFAIAATMFPHALSTVAALVDLVLFAVGCAAFFGAYATAVARSRSDEIALAGLFFLSESAPRAVTTRFRLVLAVQGVVAVVAASIRPFTPLAFGVLVPVIGLGLMGLWGARHGTFPPRPAAAEKEDGT